MPNEQDSSRAGPAPAPQRSTVDDNLLEVITRALPSLRKSERRVAEAVLEDPEGVLDLTLAALSQRAGVSEPTVIRFSSGIGCGGFRDFRVKLARSLAFARTTSHSAISQDDDLADLIGKMFDYNLSSLTWARAQIDPIAIRAAVDAIVAARRIEFFGYGASAVVAMDAQQKFPLFGVPCGAPLDGHQMVMTAAVMQPGDVVVAISNTGETPDVVTAARTARERGATTIGITGGNGPLLAHCDVPVIVETLENTDIYTPTVSRLSAMVVVDILSTAVSLARDEAHRRRYADMKTLLSSIRSPKADTQGEP